MRKIFFISIAAAMSFLPLANSANADLSEILKRGKVNIAVPESFPPFGSLGADGEHQGYDVDVAKLVAKDLGVDLELVPVTIQQAFDWVKSGRISDVKTIIGILWVHQLMNGIK